MEEILKPHESPEGNPRRGDSEQTNDARRMLRLILVLCVAHVFVSGIVLGEASAAETDTALPSLDEALHKLDPVLPFLDLQNLGYLDEKTVVWPRVDGPYPRIKIVNKDAGVRFTVDTSPTGLSWFNTMPSDVPEGLGLEAAIGREAVLSRINLFLQRLGIDVVMNSDDIEQDSPQKIEGAPPQMLSWEAMQPYRYKGVDYAHCRVRVGVSAYTGRIFSFSWRAPTGVPESMEVRFSADEAKALAIRYCEALTTQKRDRIEVSEPWTAILVPEDRWRFEKAAVRGDLALLDSPRLAHSVQVCSYSGELTLAYMSVVIDCYTGKLIGISGGGILKPGADPFAVESGEIP